MIFIDLETTGLLEFELVDLDQQPRITQICVFKTETKNNKEVIKDKFVSFINPEIHIPQKITELTGISDENVIDAPKFVDIIPTIQNLFLGEEWLVGHNINFDATVLMLNAFRYGALTTIPMPPYHFDTMLLAKDIFKPGEKVNLKNVYEKIVGGKIINWHNAEADTLAVLEIYNSTKVLNYDSV